jgi:hypothetical protein
MIKHFKVTLLTSFASIFFVLSFLSMFNVSFAGFENGVGFSMEPNTVSLPAKDMINSNVGSRTYTIDELFSRSAGFAIPYGTLEEDNTWILGHPANKIVEEKNKNLSEEAKERLKKQGGGFFSGSIRLWGIPSSLAIMGSDIATSVAFLCANIISWLVKMLFDPPLVKALVELIGGTDAKAGLISNLGKNVFYPLSTLAFLTVAVYLIWEGLIKRKFRASFGALGWSLLAFALGVFTVVNGQLVAKAPTEINATIANCVLSAASGKSCLNSTGTNPKESTNSMCDADTSQSVSAAEAASINAGRFSCIVNKAIVYDRWAEQQFGYSLDELWTVNPPDGYKVWPQDKLSGAPTDYCVNFYTADSPNQMSSATKFTSNSKCNIALAFMASRTDADFGEKIGFPTITGTAAMDSQMWNAYSGNGRTSVPILLLIASFIIVATFVPVVVYALVYNITATILTVFAPIFLLIGIHPGRGRKIFLGWLESIISNILKYMASCFLVIVMIFIYGAAFSKMNQAQVFVASVILGVTFVSYRKELVNLMGAVNMGGARVSNIAGEKLSKAGQKAKYMGMAAAGGAIGGTLAGINDARESGKLMSKDDKIAKYGKYKRWLNPGNYADTLNNARKAMSEGSKGAVQGLRAGTSMELKRGRGLVANAARQAGQVGNELAQQRKEAAREIRENEAREQMNESMRKGYEHIAEVQRKDLQEREVTNSKQAASENLNIPKLAQELNSAGLVRAAQQMTEKNEMLNSAESKEDVIRIEADIKEHKQISTELMTDIKKNGGDVVLGTDKFADKKVRDYEDRALAETQRLMEVSKGKSYEAEVNQLINERLNEITSKAESFTEDMRMIAREDKGIDIEKVTATVKDLDNQFSKDYQSMQQEFESIVNANKEVTKPKEVNNSKEDITKEINKDE